MSDLPFQSATALAAALRRKEVSSRELLATYLARVEGLNPRVNAVVDTDVERARKEAAEADEALARGEVRGPLHGLPMTVKDAFETTGMRTTAGDPDLADHVATTDADAVTRLREAGAIVFGKTNMPTQGADWQTFNDVYGTTNNPWDLTRTSGGSSGGSAAALAAGLTAFEMGSDIAGSLRVPSSHCGTYGLKTSAGIVPHRGHVPGDPGSLAAIDLVVMGPMGRSADDLDLGLDVLAGADPVQAPGWRLELPGPRQSDLSGYRIAAWFDDPHCPIDSEVGDVLVGAADALRAAGATVVETPGPIPLQEAHQELYRPLLMAVASSIFPDEVFEQMLGGAEMDPEGEMADFVRVARMITTRHRDWLHLDERRQQATTRWAQFFTEYDALLCPVSPTAAIPHDHDPDMDKRFLTVNGERRSYEDHQVWTGMVNMAFLPSAAAPVGLSRSGLPVGVQVVGPYLGDRTSVDVARHLGRVVGGFTPPPGY
jgi:amidase